jgi:hypothetical protein
LYTLAYFAKSYTSGSSLAVIEVEVEGVRFGRLRASGRGESKGAV